MNELINQMATDVTTMTLGEKMTGGLVVTLFAMTIVVLVLVIIMYAIKALTAYASSSAKKADMKKAQASGIEKIEQVAVESNDEEVVAAIMAAINSYYASSQSKIVIKNIAKKDHSTWANAGMLDQLNSRL
ncbi:MAG: OadG family protein [Proteocatella sp.]